MSETNYKEIADSIIRYSGENNDPLSLMIAQTAATLHLADVLEKFVNKFDEAAPMIAYEIGKIK